ncbi:hypothetical protein COMNV_00518 [Commensalibacter sp. Nvir]|uniref:bacteriohopanetetrol glucosamine biosynthesis glycosyltransferase HpnI n=1 Tax=Commensalibacter sp. Nvir TaxID=3069817 RepID=UPI002D600DD4|nr:hypothetical protein COMNV_00518 [Commensalibacter sp. Nvir]
MISPLIKLRKINILLFFLTFMGCIYTIISTYLVHSFKKKNDNYLPIKQNTSLGVTLFKPLAGYEPLLYEALKSFCDQDYPNLQVIFGLQDPNDPAKLVVEKLKKNYPNLDINIVIDTTIHGYNRKISNLINMLPIAKYEIFIISDSDTHAPHKNYIQEMLSEILKEKIGLVTSLYNALPSSASFIQALGSSYIDHQFLPGVLLSRWFGRQDCLGATIAIRRSTLKNIGGFRVLLPYVADDAAMGKLIKSKGLDIAISPTIIQTTVSEKNLRSLYDHELRWNRTIFILEPLGFTFSFIQLPLFWCSLIVLFNPLTWVSWFSFLFCWLLKNLCYRSINNNLKFANYFTLLLCRDWLSAIIMIKSFFKSNIKWRGHIMTLENTPDSPITNVVNNHRFK